MWIAYFALKRVSKGGTLVPILYSKTGLNFKFNLLQLVVLNKFGDIFNINKGISFLVVKVIVLNKFGDIFNINKGISFLVVKTIALKNFRVFINLLFF